MIKGEKRYIGVSVSSDEAFTIDSGTYKVKTSVYEEIGVSGNCDIDVNDVYFLCDTTNGKFKAGTTYHAYITINIKSIAEVIIGMVPFNVTN